MKGLRRFGRQAAPRGSKRRRWVIGTTIGAVGALMAWAAVGFADNPSGCDFAPNGTTAACLPPLAGSTFAGGDGNLLASPSQFGSTDWTNVPGLNAGFDLPSGSSDNSFGQGTKEDNSNVTVVTGSIPPNKNDLTRFYEASQLGTNNDNFLYLAWERTNNLGTANFDFEINQKTQPNLLTSGAKTLNRTAGDLLVTYDFTNGGGTPTIGLLRWLTSATVPAVPGFATNSCEASGSPPCWGDDVTLNGTDSIGAVNNVDAVSDPLFPNSANAQPTLQPGLFGETAIDLTKAGVFPNGTCTAFGSAMVTSRSSASFTSEIKDFIAPIPITISNCGEIRIVKQTDPRGLNQSFGFTSGGSGTSALIGATGVGGVTCPGKTLPGVQSDGSFCLNDTGNTGPTGATGVTGNSVGNTVDEKDLQEGTYTVSEGSEPNGFTAEPLTCTPSGPSGSSATVAGQTATIHLTPSGVVTCLYVNQENTATLSTNASNAGPVFPSTAVHDTATVTGNQTADTPSGNVEFYLCGPIAGGTGACTSSGTDVGHGTLSGTGATATAVSPDVNTSASPLAPGYYCFRSEWGGDNNYPAALKEFGGTSGTNECFTVQTISTGTVTTPSVGSDASIVFGTTVTDHAVVTATATGGGAVTGTATFYVCNPATVAANNGNCSSGGTQVGSPVTLQAEANSSPPASFADSTPAVTANQTGTWCFRSVYTPGGADASNYTGSGESSTDECFTVTDTTTASSAQTWLPNDTATVAPGNGAPLNGTLSIQLYTGDNCGATSGSAVGQPYTKPLSNATSAADRTLTTSNTTNTVSTSSSVSWLVTFSSSDSNVTGSSECEKTTLTITN